MEMIYELAWRAGPLVIAAITVAALAFWSIGQAERKARRKP